MSKVSSPHTTLSDMLTKNITEVVVYFRSDEDGMKRYEEFFAEEFRGIFEQLEAAQQALREIAYDGPNPGLRRSEELQWASDVARRALASNPASEPEA